MTFKTKHVRIGKWWIEGEFTRKPCLVERLMEESKVIFEAVNPKLGYFSDFFDEVKLLTLKGAVTRLTTAMHGTRDNGKVTSKLGSKQWK